MMSWLAPLSIALLLLLGLRLSRLPLRGKVWQLLRVLLPSWRFFEDIELGPRLWVRVRQAGHGFSEWQLALRMPQRGPGSLLLAAETNGVLAQQSLVEELWSELDGLELDAAPRLVSYQLVQSIAERRARALQNQAAVGFQFCLSEGAAADGDASFVSLEHVL
jgi:hypothetical protein